MIWHEPDGTTTWRSVLSTAVVTGSLSKIEREVRDLCQRVADIEQLRDIYGRNHRIGLISIGTPGLERRVVAARETLAIGDVQAGPARWIRSGQQHPRPPTSARVRR